ncbi:MAG: hypothetical protein IH822_05905 [Chloroflexi bacterium]|nr:hypothetical protein [Chloroflexota bacterium]
MRTELQGSFVDDAKGNREPVNVVLREGCSCKDVRGRRWIDEDCPVHGYSLREESDSKAEPRWMRQKRQWLAGEEGGRLSAAAMSKEFEEDDIENEEEIDDGGEEGEGE